MKKPLVIAHRGASYELPGNTMPAIAKAMKDGSDVIEVDVRKTKDGVLVLGHDKTEGKLPFMLPAVWHVLENVPKSTVFYFDIKEEGVKDELKRLCQKYNMHEYWYSNKQPWIFAQTPLLYIYPFLPVNLYKVFNGREMVMPSLIPNRMCIYFYEHIPSAVRFTRALGRKLFVWGVNSEHEMRKWIELGADGLITDRPGFFRDLISKYYK